MLWPIYSLVLHIDGKPTPQGPFPLLCRDAEGLLSRHEQKPGCLGRASAINKPTFAQGHVNACSAHTAGVKCNRFSEPTALPFAVPQAPRGSLDLE